jgi:hypothetical protein
MASPPVVLGCSSQVEARCATARSGMDGCVGVTSIAEYDGGMQDRRRPNGSRAKSAVLGPLMSGYLRDWSSSSWTALAGAIAGVSAAALYSSFVLAGALHSRLSPVRAFVSELEAAGQPHSLFFRLTDLLSGVLIIGLAAATQRQLPKGAARDSGCLSLVVLGLSSCVDGIKAMPCAPSLNAACRSEDQTERGMLLQLHQAHSDSSVLGVIAAAVAMLLLGTCLATQAHRLAAASFTAATLVIGLGLSELVAMLNDGPVGLIERMQILVVSGWLAGLALSLPTLPSPP